MKNNRVQFGKFLQSDRHVTFYKYSKVNQAQYVIINLYYIFQNMITTI